MTKHFTGTYPRAGQSCHDNLVALLRLSNIHGIGAAVHGDASILEAIHARLLSFASDGVRFEFFDGNHRQVHVPSGVFRTVYDPEDSEVLYERADRLYMTEHVPVVCDPGEGCATVALGLVPGDRWQ